ncbi:hypothetical protein V1511DRAFT_510624 [Dipodascopsis uninucleata]
MDMASSSPSISAYRDQQEVRLTADMKKHFYRELQTITRGIDKDLRQRISSVHTNAKHISVQSRNIRSLTYSLVKETRKWEEIAGRATMTLKEAGDVQNWAEILEVEISALEETIRLIEDKSLTRDKESRSRT